MAVDVEVVTPIIAEAEVQKYTLVSDDIYVRRYDNSTIPIWYRDMIRTIIASDPSIVDVQAAVDYLTTLGTGYSQSIANLETADSGIMASVTALNSTIGSHTALIGEINLTKVDSTTAQAIATNVVGSAFGEGGTANAWFTSKISTYASNTQANTNSISTLNVSLGSTNVRIDTVESVNIAQGASISQLALNTGVAIADLQHQIDGSVSTWFYATSPEYSTTDTTVALRSTSTNTGTELITGALVFDTVHSQMYKYIGTYIANYNLTTATFSDTLLWTPVYKMVLPEASWLATDAGASPARHSLSIDSGTELVTNALVYHVQTDQMYQYIGAYTVNVNLTLENYADTLRWTAVAHTKIVTQRTSHIGDLYYDNVTGFAYRYIHSDINDTPDQGLIFSWLQIVDSDTVTALANAATAQHTADGKRTVFYTSTAPIDQVISGTLVPIEEGDLWVNSTTKITKIYAKTSTLPDVFQWVDITNTATQNALIGLGTLEETNDGVVYTYYSPTAPTLVTHPTMSYGDWWVDTDAIPIVAYRYEDINGKITTDLVTYPLAWRDQSNSILGKSMIESDTAKKNIAKVVDGTLAISITNATVNGTAIGAYVAGEIDKEVVVFSGTDHTTQIGMKLNDIYIEKTTSAGISGVIVDVVNTWKYNGTTWESIGSNSNLTALADLADGKRTIFSNVSNDVPVGEVNDVWMPTTGTNDTTWIPGEIYRYNGSTWVISTRYSANIVALQNTLQDQIDGKVDTYYQGTVPYADQTNVVKDIRVGDYWYCTADVSTYIKGNVYKYVETVNGSNYNYTWTLNADVTKSAFDAIDGKKTIFGGATVPTAIAVNDVWIPNGYVGTLYTNGFMYQWNDTIWADTVTYTDDTVANLKSQVLYTSTEPTLLTHPLLDNGDQWVNTSTNELKVWNGITQVWDTTTNDTANKAYTIANAEKRLYNAPLGLPTPPVPVSPIVLGSGDLWVVTDMWYTTATDVTSSATLSAFGNLVKRYDAVTAMWSDITNTEAKSSALQWTAKSSKYITAPDGSITGFEMSDGSGQNSAFTITADTFKVVASGQSVASKNPLTVDAATGDITFNGKVSFNSVTDVPALGSTPQQVVDAVNAGSTTTINGGHITAGTITTNSIATVGLDAGVIKAGVMYNTGGSSVNYTMKIDLDNGLIHII